MKLTNHNLTNQLISQYYITENKIIDASILTAYSNQLTIAHRFLDITEIKKTIVTHIVKNLTTELSSLTDTISILAKHYGLPQEQLSMARNNYQQCVDRALDAKTLLFQIEDTIEYMSKDKQGQYTNISLLLNNIETQVPSICNIASFLNNIKDFAPSLLHNYNIKDYNKQYNGHMLEHLPKFQSLISKQLSKKTPLIIDMFNNVINTEMTHYIKLYINETLNNVISDGYKILSDLNNLLYAKYVIAYKQRINVINQLMKNKEIKTSFEHFVKRYIF